MAVPHKLTYFPIAGRAFVIRVCMKASGLPFEDVRLPGPEYREKKATMDLPLGQLPVMTIGDKTFCQSTALARYAAKKAGLYPKDDLLALLVDEVSATLDEMWSAAPFGGAPEELKTKREAWIATISDKHLKYYERRLTESGGPFVLGSELSLADLWLFGFAEAIEAGFLDHVPRDLLAAYPRMTALHKAVKEHPVIVAHGA